MLRTGTAGKGSYGVVYNALTEDKNKVAVKTNITNKSINFSGSLKELDLLIKTKDHPYIISLIDVTFKNPFSNPKSSISSSQKYKRKEDYVHFILEMADDNLHTIIYEETEDFGSLKLAMVQSLLAVEYIHSQHILHRDIKPGNFLWFNKKTLKLCDFGLSKVHTNQESNSSGVVTCWYRAPEICAWHHSYSYPSDIWSIGTVFYEMISKTALLSGCSDNDTKLLSKMIGLIKTSTSDISKLIKNRNIKLTRDARPNKHKSLKELMGLSSEQIKKFNKYPGTKDDNYTNFLDLLSKLLKINPDKRLTATEALDHPFFNPYNDFKKWSRKLRPPVYKSPKINIIKSTERIWAVNLAFEYYNNSHKCEWYKPRIIFQSIDLFDRYLYYLYKNKDIHDNFMDEESTKLKYIVCIYICIKYFSTLDCPIPFRDLFDYKITSSQMRKAENFEKKLLRILKCNIYRETVYEAADKAGVILSSEQIGKLLHAYGSIESQTNVKPIDLFNKLIK